MYLLSERESDSKHARNCVYLMKIENSSLVATVMLSIYAKLSSHVLAIQERESGSKHARNYVYLSKIENSSYHQEFDL